MQSRLVFCRDRVIFDHRSKRNDWSVEGHSEPPFVRCFPIRKFVPNISQIAVTFHRICPPFFHPDLIATILQRYLLSLCELLFQHSHLFLCGVDVECFQERSSQDLPNSKLVSSSAPGTSLGSSKSPEKSLFCTGRIVTTVLLSLVPPGSAIHFLH